MRRLFLFLIVPSLLAGCTQRMTDTSIRYLPIGDSYTIGQGIDAQNNWPTLLTARLREAGIAVDMVANPARTGWTTQDAISKELPIFEEAKPTFSTLLIGVNDWVQGVDAETFRERLSLLLDRMQSTLPRNRLIVITIPDFSVTPSGRSFGDTAENADGIRLFNQIIAEEAAKRSLSIADLFTLSQAMGTDPTLVAEDGLHPSAKEHLLWLDEILPVALKLFKS